MKRVILSMPRQILVSTLSIVAVALALGLAGCGVVGFDTVRGDGKVVTEDRAFTAEQADGVRSVRLTGSPTVKITVAGDAEPTIKVITDSNIQPLILTDIAGEEIHVHSDGSYSTSDGVVVEITLPNLAAAHVSGSGDIDVTGLAADSLTAMIRGSGDITLVGNASDIQLSISGSGDIDARNVPAKTATASITGSGDIMLFASESADLTITGSGDIDCWGNPSVNMKTTGSGEVTMRSEPKP